MIKTKLFIFFFILSGLNLGAQTKIEGYIFENNNRGYLQDVTIEITGNNFEKTLISGSDGVFDFTLPSEISELQITTKHGLFHGLDTLIAIEKNKDNQFIKIALERKPAYNFDVVLNARSTSENYQLEGITGAKVEIFNNTTGEEVLIIDSLTNPNFNFALEQGNHYTLLIRKKGFFNKRLEAFINVDGCILCFEGLNLSNRNALDVLTKGNRMGTILANIQLIPSVRISTLELKNIHYDYDKWDIRADAAKELDIAIAVIQQNKVSRVELESHTDSRGSDKYNLNLSQKRAESAVAYIVEQKGVEKGKIFAKGYGETQIINQCLNRVDCTDEDHELNRRTIIKIHVIELIEIPKHSLKEIILEERLIQSTEGSEIYIKQKK